PPALFPYTTLFRSLEIALSRDTEGYVDAVDAQGVYEDLSPGPGVGGRRHGGRPSSECKNASRKLRRRRRRESIRSRRRSEPSTRPVRCRNVPHFDAGPWLTRTQSCATASQRTGRSWRTSAPTLHGHEPASRRSPHGSPSRS